MLADQCKIALESLAPGNVHFAPFARDGGALPEQFIRIEDIASEPIGQPYTGGCPCDRETVQISAWADTRLGSQTLARACQDAVDLLGVEHVRGALTRWDNEARMHQTSFDVSTITLRDPPP